MNARLWHEGQAIAMTCDAHGKPLRFRWAGQRHVVERICNRWRVHEGWWQGEQGWREYIKLTTEDGLLCLVVRDLTHDTWALVRLYD